MCLSDAIASVSSIITMNINVVFIDILIVCVLCDCIRFISFVRIIKNNLVYLVMCMCVMRLHPFQKKKKKDFLHLWCMPKRFDFSYGELTV